MASKNDSRAKGQSRMRRSSRLFYVVAPRCKAGCGLVPTASRELLLVFRFAIDLLEIFAGQVVFWIEAQRPLKMQPRFSQIARFR